jgi:ribosome-associated protein
MTQPLNQSYTNHMPNIGPLEVAQRAVEIASDKQATDIILLDIQGVATFADYFVLLSADSMRQINALVEDIALQLKTEDIHIGHKEGTPEGGWVLLDYGDVLIHVFSPEEREYYRLEELWKEAIPLVQVQ